MTSLFLNQEVIWSIHPYKQYLCTIISSQTIHLSQKIIKTNGITGTIIRNGRCIRKGRTRQKDVVQIKTSTEMSYWIINKLIPLSTKDITPITRIHSLNDLSIKIKSLPKPITSSSEKRIIKSNSLPLTFLKNKKIQINAKLLTDIFKSSTSLQSLCSIKNECLSPLNRGLSQINTFNELEVIEYLNHLCLKAKDIYENGDVVEIVVRISFIYSQILILWEVKTNLFGWNNIIKHYCNQIEELFPLLKIIASSPLLQHFELVRRSFHLDLKLDDLLSDSRQVLKESRLFLWNDKIREHWNSYEKLNTSLQLV
ncbi:hypothetical protein EDI_150850 [Entamoeba dispar SAW760]|uniref:Uncharacterized protein n=1 Tax=Entamoeba dispar (strain ATCC PRA-260 / SAW760) TaxID=370354 RepID=B0EQ48_ENTDS|nr:uncharacterized protein EDI_150850 [Entamoeba dispar SAW760]EDR23336.1 hypothetical protein EDI_150850 [Entamoeba dispar SAW760]|eukprot:EDR23336.1 hypothetical protein EDI_150850 [Entamoeba dispar SAW760]